MRTLLAAVLLTLPAQAAEPLVVDVMCDQHWCRIKKETLKELLTGAQKLQAHVEELRHLCGWNK